MVLTSFSSFKKNNFKNVIMSSAHGLCKNRLWQDFGPSGGTLSNPCYFPTPGTPLLPQRHPAISFPLCATQSGSPS